MFYFIYFLTPRSINELFRGAPRSIIFFDHTAEDLSATEYLLDNSTTASL